MPRLHIFVGVNRSSKAQASDFLEACTLQDLLGDFWGILDSDSVYWTCSQNAKNQKAKQTIMHCTTKQYKKKNAMHFSDIFLFNSLLCLRRQQLRCRIVPFVRPL